MGIKEDLAKKWNTDYFSQKLKSIAFNEVGLRGVKNVEIKFNYPITAIAGTNGIGKTTILQLIACLYHNRDKNYKPYRFSNSREAKPYYTFTDFLEGTHIMKVLILLYLREGLVKIKNLKVLLNYILIVTILKFRSLLK